LRRRLLGLLRRRYDTPSSSCRVYRRSRLTCVAWAAPTAGLCALVTRDQQYSLAEVTSGSVVAERTFVSRIERGRWASLPKEASRLRACLRLRTRGGSGPPQAGCLFPSPLRGPVSIWGSGTPWEVRGPRLFWLSAPFSGTRGDSGPVPERDAGPGPLVQLDGVGPQGTGCSAPLGVVTDNYISLDTARGGTLVRRYRQV